MSTTLRWAVYASGSGGMRTKAEALLLQDYVALNRDDAVGAQAPLQRLAMGAWMTSLEMRAPRNVLIVATANKLARIAWAVLSSGQETRLHIQAD